MADGQGEGGDVATPLLDGGAADGPPAEPPPVWTDELRGARPGVPGRAGEAGALSEIPPQPCAVAAATIASGSCFRQSVSGNNEWSSPVTEVNR